MKFEELKKSLLEKVANAYMLKGVDEFLLSSSYNLIYKYSAIEMPDLNLIKFSATESTFFSFVILLSSVVANSFCSLPLSGASIIFS